ncbi:fibrinogen C domain-containing protein 1-A-like [Zophobas morio]|uniref:fibrinogen C domain-containing protein 1-A-like n=1 Tax=Zophobas morio TaxID=2755281 RepID=UPI0030834346
MSTKLCALVLLTLAKFSLQSNNDNVVVVSTTERTSPPTENTNKLDEIQTKLATLEAEIAKLQKTNPETNTCTKHVPTNCKEIQTQGHNISGIYTILPKYALEPFKVYCNMQSQGGGWTVIMNRYDGSQDFYLDWKSYKNGFGKLEGEFWLGLEKMHLLTGYEYNELLIELVDWDNKQLHAHYQIFRVGDEVGQYAMDTLRGYSGTAGDYFSKEAGMKFTTKDRDNDVDATANCADWSNGGWWYRNCKRAHLTGKLLGKTFPQADIWKRTYWIAPDGSNYSLKEVRLMVRPMRPKFMDIY